MDRAGKIFFAMQLFYEVDFDISFKFSYILQACSVHDIDNKIFVTPQKLANEI